jgi:hypothetical protein
VHPALQAVVAKFLLCHIPPHALPHSHITLLSELWLGWVCIQPLLLSQQAGMSAEGTYAQAAIAADFGLAGSPNVRHTGWLSEQSRVRLTAAVSVCWGLCFLQPYAREGCHTSLSGAALWEADSVNLRS